MAPRSSVAEARLRGIQGHLVAWAFLAPALILFTFFKFIPMARACR